MLVDPEGNVARVFPKVKPAEHDELVLGALQELQHDPVRASRDAVRALGDLLSNIWQVCYVTRDLDQGMELLRDRYGIESTEVPTEGATFLVGDEPVRGTCASRWARAAARSWS